MTPSKSMLKGACDSIGPQVSLVQGAFHPLHGAVCYAASHLCASVRLDALARDAWYLARSSPPHPGLAGGEARPLPRAENLGRTGALAPRRAHRVAVPPLVEGQLWEDPSAGDMVGRGSPAYVAPTQGRDALSRGGGQGATQAGDAASTGTKGAQKRASAVVVGSALRSLDR